MQILTPASAAESETSRHKEQAKLRITLRFEEQGRASVVLGSSHPSRYPYSFRSLQVFNTWRIVPASAGTVAHWASLKVLAGELSGARGCVCHQALWWVPYCQSDGRWFSSKTSSYLLLSWIISGTYCHTLDSPEADAKVKSGAHDVSQGSSPVSGRGYEQDWTEGLAELWVSPNKAPVNLVMTQGMSIAIQGGPKWLGLRTCLAQYTPDIRWGALLVTQILKEPAARDCCQRCLRAASPSLKGGLGHTSLCLSEYPVILLMLLSFSCPKLHARSVPPILVGPAFLFPFIFTQRI